MATQTQTQTQKNGAPATTKATKPAEPKSHKLTGEVHDFHVGGKSPHRLYMVLTVPFKVAREILHVAQYSAESGKGEQRGAVEPWQNKLSREMEEGNFTPAPWSASVRASHIKDLGEIEAGKDITLMVGKTNPLALIDGQQRMGAMTKLYNKSEPDVQKIMDACPITFPVFLDPNRVKQDFIHLQQGRPVDTSHLLSMRLAAKMLGPDKEPVMKLAIHAARLLNNPDRKDSPFSGRIKFDSSSTNMLALNSLATTGGSDIGTSMYGGAKIASHFKKDAKWLAEMYIAAYQAIVKYGEKKTVKDEITGDEREATVLLMNGKLLCPPENEGKKGNASLLVGVGNMLAFRMGQLGRDDPRPQDLKLFVEKIGDVFNASADGNLSGPTKRQLIGEFARLYFRDMIRLSDEDEAKKNLLDQQDDVPLPLIELLSKSTLAVNKNAAVNGYKAETNEDETFEEEDETAEDTSESGDQTEEEEETPPFEEPEDETEDDFTPPPPQKTGRAARGAAPATRGRKVEPIEA